MKTKPTPKYSPPPCPPRKWLVRAFAGTLLLHSGTGLLSAALPQPLVNFRYSENSGTTTANSGSLGGTGELVSPDGFPVFAASAPTGNFAPLSNTSSLDFGTIAAGQGGRALDLTPAGADPTLGTMEAFTVCGWVNARQLNEGYGGNRIAFALASGGGPGFDLVQLGNGALRLGVNDWPDGGSNGPASAAGKVTANAAAGAGNWVYFAVTYDSNLTENQVKYFFGSGTSLAGLSSSHNYARGPIDSSGSLTVGNFSAVIGARPETGDGGSRIFRGLVDELKIYSTALDLTQVQEAQLNGALAPQPVTITAPPASRSTYEGSPVTFTVTHGGTAPFSYKWQRDGVDIPGAADPTYTLTAPVLADTNAKFRVKITNATSTDVTSEAATLTVVADSGLRVSFSFSEGNTSVSNRGTLGGTATYTATNGFPQISSNVPVGAMAPANNFSSVNFGTIGAGQGSRAIDLANPFDNTLGALTKFTISGWINCADLDEGFGGNRIAFALASPGGPGVDLVQTESGGLRLGINDWPDGGSNGPASSTGIITADPESGSANWIFFAVTYDSTLTENQVAYYFGSPTTAAAPDLTATYDRGPIVTSGPVTAGNFGPVVSARTANGPNGQSRCFRGLIDELNIDPQALTLEQIQARQKAAAYQPANALPVSVTQAPQNATVFAGGDAVFGVSIGGTPPYNYQWWRRHAGVDTAIPGATNPTYTFSAAAADSSGDQFRVVVSNLVNSLSSGTATLTVLPETNLKAQFKFDQIAGGSTPNLGNLGGNGAIVAANDFPALSANVPTGAFAPKGNPGSIDFGTIADGQGGRAVNLNGGVFGAQAGPMKALTLTGWLNCRDLQAGPGGNRIVCAHNFLTDPGFDLVQNADGTLQLGVNAWPDYPLQGPRSSPLIAADPEAGAANWIFFAVTYDSTAPAGQATYYFGSPSSAAVLDISLDYPQGAFASTGALTVGNLNTADDARNNPGVNSRCFRGLMDEIQVYNKVLNLSEIQAQQAAGGPSFLNIPLSIARDGVNVVLSWTSPDELKLQATDNPALNNWANDPTPPVVSGNNRTVNIRMTATRRFYRLAKF
ncbi:MAG: LamG-like jellyroll fold domain-containing protein [Verrucomicrobiota bacterium]